MFVKLNGARIFFAAIESISYDLEVSKIKVRTLSGAEHFSQFMTEDQAEALIYRIVDGIALCDSIDAL